eukprot:jgi/Chlat1/788/Chrsp104S01307
MPLRQPDFRFDRILFSLTTAAARLRSQLLEVAWTLPSLLKDGPELAEALHRYETYWLPLLASGFQTSESVAPPADVHWVWQCHMLSPTSYASDMQRVFGMVLDHALLDVGERLHAQQRACAAWEERYPGVPFESQPDGSNASNAAATFVSQCEFDIKGVALRQAAFIYQVALPHYGDTKVFLPAAVERYRQFCYLHASNPDVCLAPTYDIQLVWRAHMLHPSMYATETAQWAGKLFTHDETLNDCTQDSQLNCAATATCKLWAACFTDEYEVNGGMLRGNPATTVGSGSAKTQYTQGKWTGLSCQLTIPSAVRTPNPRNHNVPAQPAVPDWIKCMPGVNCTGDRKWGSTCAWRFDLNTCLHTGLHTTIHVDFGISTKLPALSVRALLSHGAASTSAGDCRVTLVPSINVEPNSAQIISMPDGQFALSTPTSGHAATHIVCNFHGKALFTVQVSYDESTTSECSPVPPRRVPRARVVVRDANSHAVEATAHLSGPYELPTPQQVDSRLTAVALDAATGERVMIIRGRGGDWGMCKGTWVGKQKGVPGEKSVLPGVPGRPGIPGIPGLLQLQAFRLHKAGSEVEALCEPQNVTSAIEIAKCIRVDLAWGYLDIVDGDTGERQKTSLHIDASLLLYSIHISLLRTVVDAVPELVAFAFAAGVLHFISQRVAVAKELTEQEIEDYRNKARRHVLNGSEVMKPAMEQTLQFGHQQQGLTTVAVDVVVAEEEMDVKKLM